MKFDTVNVNINSPITQISGTSHQIFKKRELDRTSTLRVGLLEKREVTFSGGVQFLQKKNNLKSEIFNDKKNL